MNHQDSILLHSLKVLLKEAFEGPPGNSSWFLEAKPGSGLFGLLAELSAADASQKAPSGKATIAAHVHHTWYYINIANAFLRGENPEMDWKWSWTIGEMNEEDWNHLKQTIHKEYQELMSHLDQLQTLDKDLACGVLGTFAHTAYHIGALKQMQFMQKK